MKDFKIVYNDELYHHGVKGQKWGFRKQKRKASNNKIKKFLKKQKSEFLQGMHEEQNRIHEQNMRNAAQAQQSNIQEHNRIHEQNMRNVVQSQQFMNQTVQQAVNASNQAASLSITGGMNPFMFG